MEIVKKQKLFIEIFEIPGLFAIACSQEEKKEIITVKHIMVAYRHILGTNHSMNHLCKLCRIHQRAGGSHHSKTPPSHCD